MLGVSIVIYQKGGKLSSLGVIKFTQKYLKKVCIVGFIAQKVNKSHSYSIYRMTGVKKLLVCVE